jgi:formate--tetrahydrofolate ligase
MITVASEAMAILALAEAVAEVSSIPNGYSPLYPLQASLKEKIETLARRIYGAKGVGAGFVYPTCGDMRVT